MAHADATAHQHRAMLRKLLPPTSATPPAGRQKNGREKRERKRKENRKICIKEINYFLFFKIILIKLLLSSWIYSYEK
jgi:hypothetical protein